MYKKILRAYILLTTGILPHYYENDSYTSWSNCSSCNLGTNHIYIITSLLLGYFCLPSVSATRMCHPKSSKACVRTITRVTTVLAQRLTSFNFFIIIIDKIKILRLKVAEYFWCTRGVVWQLHSILMLERKGTCTSVVWVFNHQIKAQWPDTILGSCFTWRQIAGQPHVTLAMFLFTQCSISIFWGIYARDFCSIHCSGVVFNPVLISYILLKKIFIFCAILL